MKRSGAVLALIAISAVAVPVLAQPATSEPASAASPLLVRVLQVGPQRELRSLAAAAQVVRDGDTVEVDAGDYSGDVAVWSRDNLTIRGVGGRARLIAAGASAEHKAIWVARGGALLVENIEFTGARVEDRNGAGIRLEKGHLTVRNCRFIDNENGILTGGDAQTELDIEASEFGHNGAGDGLSHDLYVGSIARLAVSGSYFHHARGGHLLKSRAVQNFIRYNRLTDEAGGEASYELEFPNGGLAYVIGNIIQQGARTQNPHLIAYGAEGYKGQRNELYLVHNTLIDGRSGGGVFLRVVPGAGQVRVINNLLLGPGQFTAPGELAGNVRVAENAVADFAALDFRLRKGAIPAEKLVDPGMANGVSLGPQREYQHPLQTRALSGPATLPGALQRLAP